MKYARSNNHKSWVDSLFDKSEKPNDLTFKEEREKAEKDATAFFGARKASANKFAGLTTAIENVTPHNPVASDEHLIVNQAAKTLVNHISGLFGTKISTGKMAGCDVEPKERNITASRRDIADNSVITEKGIFVFSAKFTNPGVNKYKVANFVVEFDDKADPQYKVANVFYDEKENEMELNSNTLKNYLESESESVKTASEKPLVWFNPETDSIETVKLGESSIKIAARLKEAGYKVEENYWVDSCAGKTAGISGKLCFLVDVPLNNAGEFTKIASMSDNDWVNRMGEGGKEDSSKYMKGDEWVKRTDEKGKSSTSYGYDHKDFKKGDEWVNRIDEKGPKNPYNSEAAIMLADASKKDRKDAVKEAVQTPDNKSEITKSIEGLEKLLG